MGWRVGTGDKEENSVVTPASRDLQSLSTAGGAELESGDMMKPSGWLLSIEGHVVMGPYPFFLHGVAAFFSSYYVFNLEYPAAGSSTLEFIQRCFLGINPERGSKTKKRTTMNPHVE
ncbi:hypothetical protein ROHU_001863 [Labeo rohita]|uniref:Uncharacterized protein n=1 Tax=Labeo rohita TaxID=84645 RepID=A0A498NZB2_LABRO|nr:hypothetical protein ROHU_001863 [Labeo rohita]